MNTLEIIKTIKSLRVGNPFKGVYAGDRASEIKCLMKKEPCFAIINVAPAHHPGLHWVLLFKPPNKRKMVFFDSFALSPAQYNSNVVRAVEHFSSFTHFPGKFYSLKRAIQADDSTLCGLYCIFFAYYLNAGESINTLSKLFTTSKNKKKNDQLILKWKQLMKI